MAKNERAVSNVRDYLKTLKDRPGESLKNSLQRVSDEFSIPVTKLRSFIEGKDNSLPAPLVVAWNKTLGDEGSISRMPSDPLDVPWYEELKKEPTKKADRIDLIDKIERVRPEAAAALDVWADIAATGSIGEDTRNSGGFQPEFTGAQVTKDLLQSINDHIDQDILPDDEKWQLIRDICKYGDQFEQIVLGKGDAAEKTIKSMVNMPIRTMHVNRQPDGTFDPDKLYYQQLPHETEPSTFFESWRICHFSNKKSRSSDDGVSIFDYGFRSFVQIEALESSMMIRALERAPFRMKHTLDVGHCNSDAEITAASNNYKARNKKVRTVDRDGKMGMMKVNMPADEDWIVTKRSKESPADIEAIDGDPHMDQTGFFDHFWAKWMSVLGPPKAHLGYDSTTIRSVLTDQHVVFGRKGRRLQMKFIAGLYHLYWLELILRGKDPRKIKFLIHPPPIGTRDELMRAQVQMLHATTCKYLAGTVSTTGKQPSIEWMLKYVMGMDQEVIDQLSMTDVIQQGGGAGVGGGGGAGAPGGMQSKEQGIEYANVAMMNDEIARQAGVLHWMVSERALSKGRLDLAGAENRRLIEGAFRPFESEEVDNIAKSFGITKLVVD